MQDFQLIIQVVLEFSKWSQIFFYLCMYFFCVNDHYRMTNEQPPIELIYETTNK